MSRNRSRRLAALGALMLAALPAVAAAQSTADDRELASYRLTMEGLDKMVRVNRDLADELKRDPKYQQLMKTQAEIKALEDKSTLTEAEQKQLDDLNTRREQLENEAPGNDLLNDAKTIDQMAAKIKSFAPLSAALSKEGVAPREYAVFTLAVLQAGMAAGMQKAGMLKELPPGVNADNVKFIIDHEAEFKKLQSSFGGSDK